MVVCNLRRASVDMAGLIVDERISEDEIYKEIKTVLLKSGVNVPGGGLYMSKTRESTLPSA